jgi:hypothetical protein
MSVERTNKIYVWIVMGFLLVLPLFYLDFSPKDNIELRKGISVVRYMSAPRQLKRSAFGSTFPEGSPAQFVEWMFSPMGSAIWPPVEGGGEFSLEEEKMIRKTGIPFLPSGVSLVSDGPDMDRGQQVVVRGDDERWMLVVEGYLDPQDDPVLIKEWQFSPAG